MNPRRAPIKAARNRVHPRFVLHSA